MINMDMIGRVHAGKLYVGGAGTGTSLRSDLDAIVPRFPALHVDYSDKSGYGSSDHTSFTAKQVPVLFFFSGLHSDYHKPSDTWDKINAPDAVEVLQTDRRCCRSASMTQPERPAVHPRGRAEESHNPHAGTGDISRWRRRVWTLLRQYS